VEILAAQQTPTGAHWYQGTADAVRQNLCTFLERDDDFFIVLSGDQLYRMDYQTILQQHQESGADLTIACIPVNHAAAPGFGIMETNSSLRITRFVEKPKEVSILNELKIKPSLLIQLQEKLDETLYLASMGIYVFNRQVLLDCLNNQFPDFGKNVIPAAITTHDVRAFIFRGYWEDIGTIRSFFNANLQLTDPNSPYSFYAPDAPIYTHPHFLPTSIIEEAIIHRAIISDGCMIHGVQIERSVIGIRSVIRPGTSLKNTIMMGADFYESEYHMPSENLYPLGIGSHCRIENAIIDKNARIGNHVTITSQGKDKDFKGPGYEVRDGIVIILKNAVIPSGTVI